MRLFYFQINDLEWQIVIAASKAFENSKIQDTAQLYQAQKPKCTYV